MDIHEVLTELRAERERIEQAIAVIQRIAQGQGRRRGRPPAWMSDAKLKVLNTDSNSGPSRSLKAR